MGNDANKDHADLVRAAAAWLRNSRHCRVVATELVTGTSETPDAIGFGSHIAILVECKTSRADFFRNGDKAHERVGRGMGDERWFLTPGGLVQPAEVPEGWGLLEVHRTAGVRGYHLKRVVVAPPRERTVGSLAAERLLLVSVAQRALAALEQVRPLSLGDVEDDEPESGYVEDESRCATATGWSGWLHPTEDAKERRRLAMGGTCPKCGGGLSRYDGPPPRSEADGKVAFECKGCLFVCLLDRR